MGIEIGKCYRHDNTGEEIHVVGKVETITYGMVFVAETNISYQLKPVGSALNWSEMPLVEWKKKNASRR